MTKTEARQYCSRQWQDFLKNNSLAAQKRRHALYQNVVDYLDGCPPATPLLVYIALSDEFDCAPLLAKHNLCYYAPRTCENGIEFRLCQFDVRQKKFINLERGHHGVWGPSNSAPLINWEQDASSAAKANPSNICSLLPCLGLNAQGARLGRGGGYYDRLRDQLNRSIKAAILPHELCGIDFTVSAHDIRLNYAITEKGIHNYTIL